LTGLKPFELNLSSLECLFPDATRRSRDASSLPFNNLDPGNHQLYHPHPHLLLPFNMDAPSGVTRPIVFFDVQIGETPAGRIKMELFSDIVPKLVPDASLASSDLIAL
jgi:hypothetical protein